MKPVQIIVEKHGDGYVAYPVGMRGVVVGEGETYEQALADVKSAIRSHVETFGSSVLGGDDDSPETRRIDELSDELNREAEEVLEYQVIPRRARTRSPHAHRPR